MTDSRTFREILPDLLATQLLAAEVYTLFISRSTGEEALLWRMMLLEELDHIRFLADLLEKDTTITADLPPVRLDIIRAIAERARTNGASSTLERVEEGLRLEHAEVDFGLEALVAKRLSVSAGVPGYAGRLEDHYRELLGYAMRYRASRDIGVQIARLEEHLATTV